ncbi:putative sugar nucleotidyl transferase [candidate division KSB1 bacterium]
MNTYIFEDEQYRNFLPLTWTRPVCFLRFGTNLLYEKVKHYFNESNITILCRDYLKAIVEEDFKISANSSINSEGIFLNGRAVFDAESVQAIDLDSTDVLYVCRDTVAAAVLSEEQSNKLNGIKFPVNDIRSLFPDLEKIEIDVNILEFPWEIINRNSEEIFSDYTNIVKNPNKEGLIYPGVHLLNENLITIGKNTQIKPGVVLDGEKGPVFIDENVEILPLSYIKGPVYVGKNTTIKAGTRIYSGTSIGNDCKVGGEIKQSILQSYSNKQHDGYLGNSYLGSWVNLGANTTNSNLKNNYSNVKVLIADNEHDTGLTFQGAIIGDHVKTGINTMLNTGSVIGIHSNVFGGDFQPKFIPSFSWCNNGNISEYILEKAVNTARKAIKRRDRAFTDVQMKLISHLFKTAKNEERT